MVKNSPISVIPQEEKRDSIELQVFNFTNKIERPTSHLELHRRDYLSQRGLWKLLGKRQRLLIFLSKKNRVHYRELIGQWVFENQKLVNLEICLNYSIH